MTTNEEIRDQAIAHQIYLLRYQAQIVRKVTEILKETEADIKAQLAQINTESRTQELEAQLVGIKALIDASWAAATKELATELSALVEYEAAHQDAVIQEATPVRLSTIMPAPDLLIAAVESKPFEGKLLRLMTRSPNESSAPKPCNTRMASWHSITAKHRPW